MTPPISPTSQVVFHRETVDLVDWAKFLQPGVIPPAQLMKDFFTDRERMLQEIYELRRFKAAALCMIECLSEERPEGAVRV